MSALGQFLSNLPRLTSQSSRLHKFALADIGIIPGRQRSSLSTQLPGRKIYFGLRAEGAPTTALTPRISVGMSWMIFETSSIDLKFLKPNCTPPSCGPSSENLYPASSKSFRACGTNDVMTFIRTAFGGFISNFSNKLVAGRAICACVSPLLNPVKELHADCCCSQSSTVKGVRRL